MTGKARIYGILNGMETRCYNKSHKDYPHYGGVGITVCDEWRGKGSRYNFYNWAIANGYSDDLTIDRIDGTKGYSPDNCRWVTPSEQCRNRRSNHLIEYNGEIKTLVEWAESAGIRKDTLRSRLVKSGWSMEEALNTPILKGRERLLYRHGRQEDTFRSEV